MSLSVASRRVQAVTLSEPNISGLSGFLAAYDFTLAGAKCEKDLSGTAATALNDAIAKVREYYGNSSRAMVNTNGTDRPLLKTNGVQFDGTNDYLLCAGFQGGNTVASMTCVFRFSVDSAVPTQTDGGRLISFSDNSAGSVDYADSGLVAIQQSNSTAFNTLEMYGKGGPSLQDQYGGSTAFGTLATVICVFDNTAGGAYVNGTFVAWNKSTDTYSLYDMGVSACLAGGGTQSGGGGRVPMTLHRMAIFTGAMGSTDRATCTTWVETAL